MYGSSVCMGGGSVCEGGFCVYRGGICVYGGRGGVPVCESIGSPLDLTLLSVPINTLILHLIDSRFPSNPAKSNSHDFLFQMKNRSDSIKVSTGILHRSSAR